MGKMKESLVLVAVCSLALWGCQKPPLGPAAPLTTYFEPGVPTPFDLLYYEEEANAEGKGKYYFAKLVMRTDREGTIRLEDARTSELVLGYHVDAEHGIGEPVDTPQNSGLNDFFYNNYSEWCGKVHDTNKGKWQFCTGKHCPGGGLCIKHCVKVAGTCIP